VEHFAQLAEDRYATGEGLQYGVIKIQAEITRVVNRLELLSQQRVSAEARLNTLRSRPPETSLAPVSMPSLPELPSPELDLEALYALGESSRPELDAALDEIEKQQLAGELARKDYWPDVTLSAGFVNVAGRRDPAGLAQPPPDNGKNVYSVSVGVNIPLRRDRYRAAELAAVERAAAGRDRYRSLVEEMRYEIRDAVNRLETLERQLDLYREALVPQAESALASAETAYETGLVGALELLDSERVLIDVRLAQARFAADYMQALSRLERALGTRFPNP
jgi:cobalt-zinc-cadmium efflux system outer membrane protein